MAAGPLLQKNKKKTRPPWGGRSITKVSNAEKGDQAGKKSGKGKGMIHKKWGGKSPAQKNSQKTQQSGVNHRPKNRKKSDRGEKGRQPQCTSHKKRNGMGSWIREVNCQFFKRDKSRGGSDP